MTTINHDGKTLTLTCDAVMDNYGTDGEVAYYATAVDADGNEYRVTWLPTADFLECVRQEAEDGNDDYWHDNHDQACDWDNPESVELR